MGPCAGGLLRQQQQPFGPVGRCGVGGAGLMVRRRGWVGAGGRCCLGGGRCSLMELLVLGPSHRASPDATTRPARRGPARGAAVDHLTVKGVGCWRVDGAAGGLLRGVCRAGASVWLAGPLLALVAAHDEQVDRSTNAIEQRSSPASYHALTRALVRWMVGVFKRQLTAASDRKNPAARNKQKHLKPHPFESTI